MADTTKCPFCAEEISIDAVKCKHCKSFLPKGETVQAEAVQAKPKPKKLHRVLAVLLVALIGGSVIANITSFTDSIPVNIELPDTVWNSRMLLRQGISDLENATVATLIRDAKFAHIKRADGKVVVFKPIPRSLNGNEFVIRLQSFVDEEKGEGWADLHFLYNSKNNSSLLGKIKTPDGIIEGEDEVMAVFLSTYSSIVESF